MSEANHLADALVGWLSDPDNGWFTSFVEAIKGLTDEQAAEIPSAGFNCIWAVLNHMSYCQEYVLHLLRGESEDTMEREGKKDWQPIVRPYEEQAWRADCEHLLALNKELSQVVAFFSDEELAKPYASGKAPRYQIIQGIIAHNCYHTNEVISIRHMLGYWLEKT